MAFASARKIDVAMIFDLDEPLDQFPVVEPKLDRQLVQLESFAIVVTLDYRTGQRRRYQEYRRCHSQRQSVHMPSFQNRGYRAGLRPRVVEIESKQYILNSLRFEIEFVDRL